MGNEKSNIPEKKIFSYISKAIYMRFMALPWSMSNALLPIIALIIILSAEYNVILPLPAGTLGCIGSIETQYTLPVWYQ